MRPAGDGLAWVGDWCDCVNLQVQPQGEVDMLNNDQATNRARQQRGPVLDRTRKAEALDARRLNLLEWQQQNTVSRHVVDVGQGTAPGDNTKHRNQCSHTHATGSKGTGHRKSKALKGRVSRKSMAGSWSVSGHTDHCWPPGHVLTTNNNNSYVGGTPALLTGPTTTTDCDGMLLGPDQIDMLLALAVSNCTGHEMVGCCKMALQSSHVGNILRNYLVAVKYGLSDVMDRMINIIRRNFLCVSRTREFLSLPVEYVMIFMGDSYLNIQNELDMFVTALMWIDYNKQDRIAHSGRVLKCVRYAYIDPADIVQYVEPNLHLFTGQDGAEALVNLYKHHVFTQSGQPLLGYTSMVPPRRGMHSVPPRAHIVSGARGIPPGARRQSAASRIQLRDKPAGQFPGKTSGKAQKSRVSFAGDTMIPSKDTPPASGTQLGPAATAPSDRSTPLTTAAHTAAVGRASMASGANAAPLANGANAVPVANGASTAPVANGASTVPVANGASTAAVARGVSTAAVANGASTAAFAETPLAKAASTPTFGAEPLMKGDNTTAPLAKAASSPAVVGAPLANGATATAVGDNQTAQPVNAPAVAGAQQEMTGSMSEKPPENVQDKSNNSRLYGDAYRQWVCAGPSALAKHVREHQRTSSSHPNIYSRHNSACPARAGHVCPAVVSGCRDQFMVADVADPGRGSLVRSQRTYHVSKPAPSGFIEERSSWLEVDDSRRMRRSVECVGGQRSSWVEAEAGRRMRRSQGGVIGQMQQPPGQEPQPQHVFVITRSVSGPVVSLAYPNSDPSPAS